MLASVRVASTEIHGWMGGWVGGWMQREWWSLQSYLRNDLVSMLLCVWQEKELDKLQKLAALPSEQEALADK